MNPGNTWVNALIGAVITIGLSFTGFSPLLGGGLAGYLQAESPKRGATVGALSGVIAAIPLFMIMVLGFWLFVGVPGVHGGFPGGIELVVIVVMMLPMMLLWFGCLSAAGGYLGAYLHTKE
ncbi:DUF5518 domain-containing protein [Halorubrum vacuolatum]|uniref:DUF5518 domain-containing protein n=1 Tax=Halorubrum vacuolatum TaxID=63740 RepID=A0A238WCH7_HALVU|nr:DUF5518 domain-containing protein [Halorubrum vacuolatum]SNR44107.1 hypothetical protein SAMN06264855_1079 [Halorubrum vacuolatum]